MGTKTGFAVAFAALQLAAAVPAMAEPNGPASAFVFGGWSQQGNMDTALAASVGSESYTPSPCYSETMTGASTADVGSDGFRYAWPAQPLGGSSNATYARASGPRTPRG